MFDTINVKMPLPFSKKEQALFKHINWNDEGFQTKSTDCTLSVFTLKSNGTLTYDKVDGELVRTMTEAEEKKMRKRRKFCWPYKYVEKSRKTVTYKYNGVIIFYTTVLDKDGNEWWFDFSASFKNGKLQGKIKKLKGEIFLTAKKIKENELKLEAETQAEHAKLHNRFRRFMKKITFNYWSYFWYGVGRFIRTISNKTQKLDIWINRYIA